MGNSHAVQPGKNSAGIFQQRFGHGQQRLRMCEAAALVTGTQKLSVAHERHGGSPGGGFDSQYQHSLIPSTVISRSCSLSLRMVTRISEPSKASGTFSLHSTTQTPSRLR